MKRENSILQDIERLAARLKDDVAPAVHVAPQVLRRLHAAETIPDRTLAFLAAGSCIAAAAAVVLLEFSQFAYATDPFEALFQVVPPIGL